MNTIVDLKDLQLQFKKEYGKHATAPNLDQMLANTRLTPSNRDELQRWHDIFRENDRDEVVALKTWYCFNLLRKNYPVILSAAELEERLYRDLDIYYDQLKWMARGNLSVYTSFDIPKRRGGTRTIRKPYANLLKIQRWIVEKILYRYRPRKSATAFFPKRSTVQNAQPHVGASLVLNLDLADFFHSIKYARTQKIFQSLGYLHEVAKLLTNFCTCEGCLPQGAATSPALSNLACRSLDNRLIGLCKSLDLFYTRYADDMTFSAEELRFEQLTKNRQMPHFLKQIKEIIKDEGFKIAEEKTHAMRQGERQQVTGLVVNEKVNIPREKYRWLRAVIHNCRIKGVESQKKQFFEQRGGVVDIRACLYGHAHYVKHINPEMGKKLLDELELIDWNS